MHGRGTDGHGGEAGEPGAASEDPRFPSLANFREQAALLADAGVDLIALELMEAPGYGRAAIQAAPETGLPVWLVIAPVHLEDDSLGADPRLSTAPHFIQLASHVAAPGPDLITGVKANA